MFKSTDTGSYYSWYEWESENITILSLVTPVNRYDLKWSGRGISSREGDLGEGAGGNEKSRQEVKAALDFRQVRT